LPGASGPRHPLPRQVPSPPRAGLGRARDAGGARDGPRGAPAGAHVGPRLTARAMRAVIERVSEAPTDRLGALVAESEQQGFGFVRRLVDEWVAGTNRFDRPGEVLSVARVGGDVV